MNPDIHEAIHNSGWWEGNLLGRILAEEARVGRLLSKSEILGIVKQLLDEVATWSSK
jgi:hypothetical protein